MICSIAPILAAWDIRPPPGFTPAEVGKYRGSQLGVISADAAVKGVVTASFVNRGIEGTPTLLISQVEGSFRPTPAARDEFAAAAIKHFEELRLKFVVDRVELTPRFVGLTGTLIDEGKRRHLVVAAMPGRNQHAVVLFSVPFGEYPRMAPDIRIFLNSFPIDKLSYWTGDRLAVASALAGALVLTWMLLRQSRKGQGSAKTTPR
jgi:hypothetical protein